MISSIHQVIIGVFVWEINHLLYSTHKHHLLSFTLANIVNSDLIRHTYVLTQYRQQGILAILSGMNFEASIWDRFIRAVPAQQQIDNDWYSGSANAIHQNHLLVSSDPAEYVLVAAADHIYKMDYEQMLQAAIDTDADVLVSGMYMTLNQAASTFGVMEVGEQGNIKRFQEKPQSPTSHPGRDGECIISQGIYIFKKNVLLEFLREDHEDNNSSHDFGKDILPKMVDASCSVMFYDHATNFIPGEKASYWRDVGSIDAYTEALLDQTQFNPEFDVYNNHWRIPTLNDNQPMAKFNAVSCGSGDGQSLQLVAAGGFVASKTARISHAVLGRQVRVEEDAVIIDSILLDGAVVGPGANLNKTIVEEGIVIPSGCIIGYDVTEDERRGIHISPNGNRVVYGKSRL
jgi:glucose-1-phosphate adenylyltransferase